MTPINSVTVFERMMKLNTGIKMDFIRDAAAMVAYQLTQAKVPVSDEAILGALVDFKRRNPRCYWGESELAFLTQRVAPPELKPLPKKKPKQKYRPIPRMVLLQW